MTLPSTYVLPECYCIYLPPVRRDILGKSGIGRPWWLLRFDHPTGQWLRYYNQFFGVFLVFHCRITARSEIFLLAICLDLLLQGAASQKICQDQLCEKVLYLNGQGCVEGRCCIAARDSCIGLCNFAFVVRYMESRLNYQVRCRLSNHWYYLVNFTV